MVTLNFTDLTLLYLTIFFMDINFFKNTYHTRIIICSAIHLLVIIIMLH